MGRVIDNYGSKNACLLNVVSMVAVMGCSVATIKKLKYDWLTFLTCMVWGFQDGVVNTHCYTMLGSEFSTQSDPFAIFALVQGVSVFIFQTIQGKLDDTDQNTMFLYTLASNTLGILTLLFTFFFFNFKKNEIESRA